MYIIDCNRIDRRSLCPGGVCFVHQAVRACLGVGRVADALLLASCGGPELWTLAQRAALQRHPARFVRTTVAAIVLQDFAALVDQTVGVFVFRVGRSESGPVDD